MTARRRKFRRMERWHHPLRMLLALGTDPAELVLTAGLLEYLARQLRAVEAHRCRSPKRHQVLAVEGVAYCVQAACAKAAERAGEAPVALGRLSHLQGLQLKRQRDAAEALRAAPVLAAANEASR